MLTSANVFVIHKPAKRVQGDNYAEISQGFCNTQARNEFRVTIMLKSAKIFVMHKPAKRVQGDNCAEISQDFCNAQARKYFKCNDCAKNQSTFLYDFDSINTERTAISAGLTPPILEACPKVAGLILFNFSFVSVEIC